MAVGLGLSKKGRIPATGETDEVGSDLTTDGVGIVGVLVGEISPANIARKIARSHRRPKDNGS